MCEFYIEDHDRNGPFPCGICSNQDGPVEECESECAFYHMTDEERYDLKADIQEYMRKKTVRRLVSLRRKKEPCKHEKVDFVDGEWVCATCGIQVGIAGMMMSIAHKETAHDNP